MLEHTAHRNLRQGFQIFLRTLIDNEIDKSRRITLGICEHGLASKEAVPGHLVVAAEWALPVNG